MNHRISGLFTLARSYLEMIPVLIVLGALAFWGHHTGWKAPKFSQFLGGSVAAEKEDWCEAHSVPDSKCLACHPELGGGDPEDWCKEHGVPESKCTVCHPEILAHGKASDWCGEHEVPESQCTLCHPDIATKGQVPPSETGATVTLDPGARTSPSPLVCQTHAIRVQFASAEAIRKAGIGLEAAQDRPMAATVTAAGEIDYVRTLVAHLSPRVPGTIWRVEKEVGQRVCRGEVLALVDASEVGRSKSEFLMAYALVDVKSRILDRIRTSAREGYRTQGELQEAEAALREARIRRFNAQQTLINLGMPVRLEDLADLPDEKMVERIRLLGLPDEITRTLDASVTTANLVPVTAPLDGIVMSSEAVPGELVDTSRPLFIVADIHRMWVMLDVRQEDAAHVALGQAVTFIPDGPSGEAVGGTISWISTEVDERTRTVKVRADIENPDGRLRAHTFGTGRIVIRKAPSAVAVPNEAIHWEGCCHVVFVRLTDEVFQTRKVRLGARSGPYTEILVGVLPGEVVATAGSHVLKSEMLKSRLGAGCVDD
ncbi:MAG: efflux RND transporter periplasmic adaptor subunit [Planctomycetota bacterium]